MEAKTALDTSRTSPSLSSVAFSHEGLDKLESYLKACRRGQRELRREELKEILDSFGGVLWQHLDEEVAELAPEKMKAAFTLEEVLRIHV